jgi:hypothetical protein
LKANLNSTIFPAKGKLLAMIMMNKTLFVKCMLPVLSVLLLSACATAPASRDEIIKERAQARWDALLAADYATAYTFYSPGYRSQATVVDFEIAMRLLRIKRTSATYSEHECHENACKVTFNVGWTVGAPVPGVSVFNGFSYITDQWVKTNGEWWYLPEEQ